MMKTYLIATKFTIPIPKFIIPILIYKIYLFIGLHFIYKSNFEERLVNPKLSSKISNFYHKSIRLLASALKK